MTQRELENLPPTPIKTNVSGETAKRVNAQNNNSTIASAKSEHTVTIIITISYILALLIAPACIIYNLFYKANYYNLNAGDYLSGYVMMAILFGVAFAWIWKYALISETAATLSILGVLAEGYALYRYILWIYSKSIPESPLQLSINMIAFAIIIPIILMIVPHAMADSWHFHR